MSDLTKRVAIIGAGPLGITTAKAMLEQNLTPTVFEKHNNIGGVWSNSGKVWSSMRANVTKYLHSFSDYTWDPSVQLYPSGNDVCQYLQGYADHFKVTPHIKLQTKITSVKQVSDKKWSVSWLCMQTNTEQVETFDFVVVASGLFSNPSIPQIENQQEFQGLSFHSADYSTYKASLSGKKVIVVGNNNSGSDIAADLALDGALVVSTFRRAHWILKRYLALDPKNPAKLTPYDFAVFKRKSGRDIAKIPTYKERNYFKNQMFSSMLNQNSLENTDLHVNEDSWGVMMKMSISDGYIDCVKNGLIKTKIGDIKSFTSNGVYFTDGSLVEADAIVWCTGYNLRLDYFDQSVLTLLEYDPNETVQPLILYKSTFPRDVENLAFVGMVRDPIYGLGELQAKWCSQVFIGQKSLPNKNIIDENLVSQRNLRTIKPPVQYVSEDLVAYMDDIAKEVGVLPDFDKIKAEDEMLYDQLWDSLAAPVHYQLGNNRDFVMRVLNEMKDVLEKL